MKIRHYIVTFLCTSSMLL